CVVPSAPDVVVRQFRMLTFLSPSAFAISASIPGRFSWETLNCLAFGMAGTPRKECAERCAKNSALVQSGEEHGIRLSYTWVKAGGIGAGHSRYRVKRQCHEVSLDVAPLMVEYNLGWC